MKSVVVRLSEYSKQASGAEKGIVEYLLQNPTLIVDKTIHQLANETFTSASSVVRLIKKLGFKGYREFYQSLVYEVALIDRDLREKSKEITHEDNLEMIVEKVTAKNVLSLENTKKLLDYDVLNECVDMLLNCKTINLFGIGASLLVARDAYLKFLRINKAVILNDDWHSQLLQARNMSKEDIAIAISYSGMTEEVLRCVATAKEKGAKIIAITRYENNPLSQIADFTLSVSATEFIFRSGAMSSRISQLNIIDILYAAYVNHRYSESLQQLQKTHIVKPYQEIDVQSKEAKNTEEKK